jgi:phosphate transport system protein
MDEERRTGRDGTEAPAANDRPTVGRPAPDRGQPDQRDSSIGSGTTAGSRPAAVTGAAGGAGGAGAAGAGDARYAAARRGQPVGLPRPTYYASRETLDREMREIKDEVLRMGSLVADQILAALEALKAHDAEAATVVIVGDGRINEAQRHIASLITLTIATQQPVARDLRFLLSLNHVTYELERMGDHAASVAKQVRKLAPHPPLGHYVDLPRMGELAAEQVRGVLRALVDLDVVEARSVAARDDEMDHLYHKIFDDVVALMTTDSANVERGTRILFAAHYL